MVIMCTFNIGITIVIKNADFDTLFIVEHLCRVS